MSVLQSFLTLCLLYMYEYWQPHLFKAPNIVSPQHNLLPSRGLHYMPMSKGPLDKAMRLPLFHHTCMQARCASFCALFYTSGMLLFLAWKPGVDLGDPAQVCHHTSVHTGGGHTLMSCRIRPRYFALVITHQQCPAITRFTLTLLLIGETASGDCH